MIVPSEIKALVGVGATHNQTLGEEQPIPDKPEGL